MLMRAATIVLVLHGLFYVLLQLLVVAAIILSFKFYCKFYCSRHPSLTQRWGCDTVSVSLNQCRSQDF